MRSLDMGEVDPVLARALDGPSSQAAPRLKPALVDGPVRRGQRCDWRAFAQEHADAVEDEDRAYLALTAGSGSSSTSCNERDLDPVLLAEWERAKEAVTRAWEKLHRHAVSSNIRF